MGTGTTVVTVERNPFYTPLTNLLLKYPAYTSHHWSDVEEWCDANIGPWNETWCKVGLDSESFIITDPHYRTTYYFKTEKDQLLFTLRWG
jgi:hypothetical protein